MVKRFLIPTLLSIIWTVVPLSTTYAQITTGSSSNSVTVQVQNNGNSTTTVSEDSESEHSTTDSSSQTEVIIEQNGKTTRFESDGKPVTYTSEDGSVQIDLNSTEIDEGLTESDGNDEPATKNTTSTKREIKWIEEKTEEVLGDEDVMESSIFDSEPVIQPNDIFKALVVTIPTPFTQVEKMVSLIQSAVNFF